MKLSRGVKTKGGVEKEFVVKSFCLLVSCSHPDIGFTVSDERSVLWGEGYLFAMPTAV